jgi:hypothetical protein
MKNQFGGRGWTRFYALAPPNGVWGARLGGILGAGASKRRLGALWVCMRVCVGGGVGGDALNLVVTAI